MTRLADLTTLRLGGEPRSLVVARSESEVVDAVRAVDARGGRLVLLGGGSNTVAPDGAVDADVVAVAVTGVRREPTARGADVHVAAGHPWDALCSRTVAAGLAGLEALSGVPGSTGATPVQNVGAYGADVSQTLREVRVLDRRDGAVRTLTAHDCGFGYRTSRFKDGPDAGRFVVLEVVFALPADDEGSPVRYAELAAALGVVTGERAPLAAVRAAVLRLRRAKGMVVDPGVPESRSAGSFFTNPVLSAEQWTALVRRVHERCGDAVDPPQHADRDGRRKTSAAWLISHAGFARGDGDGAVRLSRRHVLALTTADGARTDDLVRLASRVRDGVAEAFGVELEPEPVWVAADRPRPWPSQRSGARTTTA